MWVKDSIFSSFSGGGVLWPVRYLSRGEAMLFFLDAAEFVGVGGYDHLNLLVRRGRYNFNLCVFEGLACEKGVDGGLPVGMNGAYRP